MGKRLTITIDKGLELAIDEAPERLGLDPSTPASERIRAWALYGYAEALERELEEQRLATYREWADAPELGASAALFEARVRAGEFEED